MNYKEIRQQIRDDVWHMDLSSNAKLMLLCICYHFNTKKGSWMIKDSDLAIECNMSTKSIRRARKELSEYGVIETKQGVYGIHIYYLTLDKESSQSGQRVQTRMDRESTPIYPTTSTPTIYPNNILKEEEREEESKLAKGQTF